MMIIAMTVGLSIKTNKGKSVMGKTKTHIWAQIGKEITELAGDIKKMKRLLGFLKFLNNPEPLLKNIKTMG